MIVAFFACSGFLSGLGDWNPRTRLPRSWWARGSTGSQHGCSAFYPTPFSSNPSTPASPGRGWAPGPTAPERGDVCFAMARALRSPWFSKNGSSTFSVGATGFSSGRLRDVAMQHGLFCPFRAWIGRGRANPGRCPGRACVAPLALPAKMTVDFHGRSIITMDEDGMG
jgi:hypothetical protein